MNTGPSPSFHGAATRFIASARSDGMSRRKKRPARWTWSKPARKRHWSKSRRIGVSKISRLRLCK
ncbi:hypothetical protein CH337_11670 [Rhodoblastus acidophilus]|nr:hypothetical protein CKO16_14045 [Rhodoblastus acidophilus]RAI19687.1 hypothetical protein CH337_11670 [Rhodoblastus acidophilus]